MDIQDGLRALAADLPHERRPSPDRSAAEGGHWLGLLAAFWGLDGAHPLEVLQVGAVDIPASHRALLDHDQAMTATLSAHFQEPMSIRVLASRSSPDLLVRKIVMVGGRTHRIAEWAVIAIALAPFGPEARERVFSGTEPFGQILTDSAMDCRGEPAAFFRLEPDARVLSADWPGAAALSDPLYGRRNRILTPDLSVEPSSPGRDLVLADVLEILPPLDAPVPFPDETRGAKAR